MTCWGSAPTAKWSTIFGRALVDDVDGVRLRVGDVDARGVAADPGRQRPRPLGRVDVARVSSAGSGRAAAPRTRARARVAGWAGRRRRSWRWRSTRARGWRGRPRAAARAPAPRAPACPRVGASSRRELQQLAVDAPAAIAAAGHEQPRPTAIAARSESATGSRPAGRTRPVAGSIAQIAAALAVAGVAAAAEHVERPAERDAGGVRERDGKAADHTDAPARRVDAHDLVARASRRRCRRRRARRRRPRRPPRSARGCGSSATARSGAPGPEGEHRAQRRRRSCSRR